MSISRRSFFGAVAGAGATLAGLPALGQPRRSGKQAKNVIFCVVDGMAMQTLSMWDHYSRRHHSRRSYWMDLMEAHDVVNGWQETRSLSSVVTDSAAASSTWGCGCRVWNGALNEYPDGTKLRHISGLVQEKGARVGLVTTARITHATPAGFAVNSPERDLEDYIAESYLTSGVDVLIGGGARHFNPARRSDKKDLFTQFQQAGYAVAKTRDEMMRAGGKRILGVFSDSHIPYTVDRDNSEALQQRIPTLAEMTTAALDRLKGSSDGFVLQIEGGRVDHGGHANDFGGMLFDQRAFEEAVEVAVNFARNDGETLVIVTTDHATGGPSLNGSGGEYFDSNAAVESWANIRASFEVLFPVLATVTSESDVQDVMKQHLGMEYSAQDAAATYAILKGTSPFQSSEFYRSSSAGAAVIMGNHSKVTWTSGNHTSEHVPITALGPMSDRIHGITPNVDLHDLMCRVYGISHRNRQMSFIEAKRHMDSKERQARLEELVAMYGSVEDGGMHR